MKYVIGFPIYYYIRTSFAIPNKRPYRTEKEKGSKTPPRINSGHGKMTCFLSPYVERQDPLKFGTSFTSLQQTVSISLLSAPTSLFSKMTICMHHCGHRSRSVWLFLLFAF